MRLGCNSNEQPGGAEVSVYTTFGTHTEADAGAVFVIGRGGLEGTELEEPEPVFTGAFAVGVSEVGRAGAVSCDAARAYGEAAGGEAMSDEGPRSKPSAGIVERLREMEMALCGASLREPQAAKLAREAADEIGRLRAALKPFAQKADAFSLSHALGHITREHLLDARRALELGEVARRLGVRR